MCFACCPDTIDFPGLALHFECRFQSELKALEVWAPVLVAVSVVWALVVVLVVVSVVWALEVWSVVWAAVSVVVSAVVYSTAQQGSQ
jgi:hypothetical protein